MKNLLILISAVYLFVNSALAEDSTKLDSFVQNFAYENGVSEKVQFQSGFADLNADGKDDAVVLLLGTEWCGSGGCTFLIFQRTDNGYSLVSQSTVTDAPIRVSKESKNGWLSLIVYSKGSGDVIMPFDGKKYPPNPSVLTAASNEQIKQSSILIK